MLRKKRIQAFGRNDFEIAGCIIANYPNEKIQCCEKISKTGGDTTFEIQITGKGLIFNSTGNFLAEEPD